MKRFSTILLAMAAVVVAAVSCNKEGNEPEGKMAVLSYEVNLSEVATKALGDGSTVDKLACAVYDGETLYANATEDKAEGQFSYTPSLYYGKTYTVVFFAYKDGAYTVSNDLETITRSGNGEAADAFTYKETVKINADGTLTIDGVASAQTASSSHSVTLARPFAQLNIGTADLTGMTKVTVTLSSCAASYSAQAGAYAGSQDVTYTSTASEFSSSKFTVGGTDYSLVSLNYLFAGSNVTATIEVYNGDNLIRTVTVNNVPLNANQKTNIYGNLVQGNLTFNVTMNAGFNEDGNNETIE